MTDRATRPRRPRASEITRAAQGLVAERGWSQVTVDDIAERVGISRRTFFNHVDSKESAVLGSLPALTPALCEQLRGEDATGDEDLLAETLRIGVAALDAEGTSLDDWRRLHDVLVANPELFPRVKDRIETLGRQLVEHLSSRPGVSEELARVVISAMALVLQTSVEDALDRPELGSFAERIETNLALLREITARP